MNMKKLFSYFIFLIIVFAFSVSMVSAKEIVAPTILEIGEKISNEGSNQFYAKGLTESDTDILIYINGTFIDYADVNIENTGTDNFYYENDLESETFEVMIIARNKKTYTLSPPTSQRYSLPLLPAPTIVFPVDKEIVIDSSINVLGLSRTNSIVEIYIDSKYSGETKFLTHESGTANFAYYEGNILKPGSHSLYLIARDTLDRESKISDIVYFKIEHPMPAPTLFEPVVNSDTNHYKPFIVGLAKNDSLIKVFVDDEYDGELLVKNHESGTANFAYIPQRDLSRGEHVFCATATDYKNKESKLSNNTEYTIRQPIILEAVQEKNEDIVSEAIESSVKEEEAPIVLSEDNIIEDNQDIEMGRDENEIGELSPEAVVENGSLNEDNKKQSKINLDLIIFLAFLLGIIVWIIWVNKELIKEKKETKEPPEN